ncbi:hypothetical protein V7157_27070 [Neobacillus drentensis]|uniref:hypothetical protein n=1 Tax=Neobacillus drentensis TaxID=220684 RepID=UPI0030013921
MKMKMNVSIQIHYISYDNKISRGGSFPLRGHKTESVAYDFWKWIKKEHPFEVILEKVINNGDQDITEMVKEVEKQEWRNIENNRNFSF